MHEKTITTIYQHHIIHTESYNILQSFGQGLESSILHYVNPNAYALLVKLGHDF